MIKLQDMIAAAEAEIETLDVEQVTELLDDENTVLVDLRDIRELWHEGKIPNAFHAPRGMLEFWVAPDSPYYKPIFEADKRFVLYCAMGWRSALATQTMQNMGFEQVCHLGGGFKAWVEAEQAVEQVERK